MRALSQLRTRRNLSGVAVQPLLPVVGPAMVESGLLFRRYGYRASDDEHMDGHDVAEPDAGRRERRESWHLADRQRLPELAALPFTAEQCIFLIAFTLFWLVAVAWMLESRPDDWEPRRLDDYDDTRFL